jgi:hypothetical protein
LVKNHKIEDLRIKTINGGYREWQAIEYGLFQKAKSRQSQRLKLFQGRKEKPSDFFLISTILR